MDEEEMEIRGIGEKRVPIGNIAVTSRELKSGNKKCLNRSPGLYRK
jgi:hypothetical protein